MTEHNVPLDEQEEQRRLVERRFRELDAVELDLHLLLPEIQAGPGSTHRHPLHPQRLPLPHLFRLLKMEEGRALCKNLPRIQFRPLPQRIRDRHETEVSRMYWVESEAQAPHLRFVLDGGGEVRYDVRGEPVDAQAPGLEVFSSRYAPWEA